MNRSKTSRLRVACAAVSGRIYAGRIRADGKEFIGRQTDVTSDVLAALMHYCPIGKERVIRKDGQPVAILKMFPPPTDLKGEIESLKNFPGVCPEAKALLDAAIQKL